MVKQWPTPPPLEVLHTRDRIVNALEMDGEWFTDKQVRNAINELGGGGVVYLPQGRWKFDRKIIQPKDTGIIFQGAGAFSQEPDMFCNDGTIIDCHDPTGAFDVEGSPSETTFTLLKDIEFRQQVDMARTESVVDLTNMYCGGMERCTIFNIATESGVAYPMGGCALIINPTSLGDRAWARDVTVGGLGGPEANPATGHIVVGGNHMLLENIHVNGMNKLTAPGLYYAVMGARSMLKNVCLFQLGTVGNVTNLIWLIKVAAMPAGATSASLLIQDFSVESYHPRADQTESIYISDTKAKIFIDRVYNSNFDQFPLCHSNVPGGLILRGLETTGSGTVTPVGFVTDFVDETSDYLSPRPAGASVDSVPDSETVYTVEMRPLTLRITGGTVTAIAHNGVSVTYVSGMSLYLEPGDTFAITYSGAPAFQAYFHGE